MLQFCSESRNSSSSAGVRPAKADVRHKLILIIKSSFKLMVQETYLSSSMKTETLDRASFVRYCFLLGPQGLEIAAANSQWKGKYDE
jgi:hypothetical protein